MAKIHVLDRHTAELIAAGEVVERPSSVVKELCENAIDAGARSISVTIAHGGVATIEIADDGSGIDAEYIPTAFVRHATSKIAREEDLSHIVTLGFRGEALASIASVAQVELLTRTADDEYAYRYCVHGGEEQGIEPAARGLGTTITVRNLFYNTPARMKFLKKDATEGGYVMEIVTQLALSHPEISFRFTRDGKQQFQTPGDGKLRGAVRAALSRDFAQDLLDVEFSENGYSVTGCVTPPRAARASRAMQFFFVNGRFVKNRTMMAALEAAYKGTLMQGKFPGAVLTLSMPAELVDVNVHPAKTEVRFAREKEVFELVYRAVKQSLSPPAAAEQNFCFKTGLEEDEADGSTTPAAFSPQRPAQAFAGARPAAQPVKSYHTMMDALASASLPYNAEGIPAAPHDIPAQEDAAQSAPPQAAGFAISATPDILVQEEEQAEPMPQQAAIEQTAAEQEKPVLRFVGEIFDTYIVTQRGEDLCLIDKHAAHERMLYEKLAQNYDGADSQMLLSPVTVQLSAEEKNAVLQHAEILACNGLEVEDFGGNAVVVRTVPCDVVPEDVENMVIELASSLAQNPHATLSEQTEWVMHSIACRAAVKAGDKTHSDQLLYLAQQVLDGEIPPFCPHGRPVILKITKKELEKQFGRQG